MHWAINFAKLFNDHSLLLLVCELTLKECLLIHIVGGLASFSFFEFIDLSIELDPFVAEFVTLVVLPSVLRKLVRGNRLFR